MHVLYVVQVYLVVLSVCIEFELMVFRNPYNGEKVWGILLICDTPPTLLTSKFRGLLEAKTFRASPTGGVFWEFQLYIEHPVSTGGICICSVSGHVDGHEFAVFK